MKPLTPDELALWKTLEDMSGVDSVLDFVPFTSPRYTRPEHLRPVAELFWRAEREPVYACISTPPRHGKTESILHWAARHIVRHPEHTVAYCTYVDSLARSKSRKAREIALANGVQLSKDMSGAKEWRTLQGGGMLATGVGGPLTGQGVNLLIVDDPIKNRADAESPTIRERIFDWFTSTAVSRVEACGNGPQGSIIVNMARWHDDDIVGRLADFTDSKVKWEIINLPAIDDGGLPLWADRWPADALDIRRRLVGEYDWSSLYLGQPRPKGSRVFKEPSRFRYADLVGARLAIGCDPAATAKNNADHSVIVVVAAKGSGVNQTVDVLDVWRGQVEIPTLVGKLAEMQNHWGAPAFIESVGGFKAVPQMLRQINPRLRVVDVNVTTDKFTRSLAVSAAWNEGRVRVPMEAPWVPNFLAEVLRFTGVGDAKDDQVDALAHAFNAVDQRNVPFERGSQSVVGA